MSTGLEVRDYHFPIEGDQIEAAVEVDSVRSNFFAGLSAVFPDGEAFFVQSVLRLRSHAGRELAEDVAAFAKQEAHHAREHSAFNRELEKTGVDLDRLVERTRGHLAKIRSCSEIDQLATTMGLEHFTAVFAAHLLKEPAYLSGFEGETLALWHWHAIEEIEHKAVAFDLYSAVTKDWPPLRRWMHRSVTLLDAVTRLCGVAWGNMADIHRAQGKRHWRRSMLLFMLARPGIVRRMLPDMLRFLRPGFHPNQIDDAAYVQTARTDLAAQAA